MKKNLTLARIAIFTAVSLILLLFIRFPIMPAAPYLIYDMADVPIILACYILGTLPATTILFVVCVLQSIFFSVDGWFGLIMHFVSSGILILAIGLLKKYSINKVLKIFFGIIALVLSTFTMAVFNYIFQPIFYGTPKEILNIIIITAVIPFNILKFTANYLISFLILKFVKPFRKLEF